MFLLAIGSLLVGCDHRKPAVSDADFKAFKASNPGMTEQCLNEYRYGGVTAWRPDDPECFEMMPAQRWSGVWFNGWEWSNFCAAPAKECPIESEHGDIWLEFAKGAYSGPDLLDSLYRIEFVGRRTKAPGRFGHLNQYDHLMIVDKVISIEKMPGEK